MTRNCTAISKVTNFLANVIVYLANEFWQLQMFFLELMDRLNSQILVFLDNSLQQ